MLLSVAANNVNIWNIKGSKHECHIMYRVTKHTASQKVLSIHYVIVTKLFVIVQYSFCDAVRYVMFTFWKLYVLELLRCVQLRFVTLRHVTFTYVALSYVAMGCEQHNKVTNRDLVLSRWDMWATCTAMSQWAVSIIKKLRIMILYSVGEVCGQHARQWACGPWALAPPGRASGGSLRRRRSRDNPAPRLENHCSSFFWLLL